MPDNIQPINISIALIRELHDHLKSKSEASKSHKIIPNTIILSENFFSLGSYFLTSGLLDLAFLIRKVHNNYLDVKILSAWSTIQNIKAVFQYTTQC